MNRLWILPAAAALLGGCAAIELNPAGERVRLTNQEPQGCEYLGDVVGTQGNAVSGGLTSDETLIVGARNDLKNKAATMGGNVVHVLTSTAGHTAGKDGGGMTSSHLLGVAYRCKDGQVAPQPAAATAEPAPARVEPAPAKAEPAPAKVEPAPAKAEPAPAK